MANDRTGKNKNQTAAERALLTDALSGKVCAKCGKEVKIKDLVHVKSVPLSRSNGNGNGNGHHNGNRGLQSYHRACYTF
ncbi:MAG: hypothetical protein HYY04_05290 [Chloroflexi bacterium]|nr:hypothetical protein [Chloroflexota bacterium]